MFNVILSYANGNSETLRAHHVETIEGNVTVLLIETETGFRRVHSDEAHITKIEIVFDKGAKVG